MCYFTWMLSTHDNYKGITSEIWLCWGLTAPQTLWVILCLLPEKGRKKDRRDSRGDKERDRKERGTGMKVKKKKKQKHSPSTLTCYKDSKPCPTASQYQLDAPVTLDT